MADCQKQLVEYLHAHGATCHLLQGHSRSVLVKMDNAVVEAMKKDLHTVEGPCNSNYTQIVHLQEKGMALLLVGLEPSNIDLL
mmetsp:Transcript_38713/g.28587  ORF Transcript_38713/g.28587 Transcript_38713/m.28587 type:complete len:83 (+) Transcript_38713:815-1063(+)